MEHPLEPFTANSDAIDALAKRVGCSPWHLRNIKAGRKGASMPLAKRLSDATGLQMEAFLRFNPKKRKRKVAASRLEEAAP